MKEERFFYVPNAKNKMELPEEEGKHAVKVLRLQPGDTIHLIDGDGYFYTAEITMVSNKHCNYTITSSEQQKKSWKNHIHLAMAPTKMMDRTEWFAEKATEIGIDEFSFLNCQLSERRVMRQDRIEKIVVGAVKQSRKAWKPVVNELENFKDFIYKERKGLKFIAHCYDDISKSNLYGLLKEKSESTEDITILIGPEGDFSHEEVEQAISQGYISISLGESRLRTETAALFSVMTANTISSLK